MSTKHAHIKTRDCAFEMLRLPMKKRNVRWGPCQHCGAEGWDVVGQRISGAFDHDRPDGRRCRAAEKDREKGRQYAVEGTTHE